MADNVASDIVRRGSPGDIIIEVGPEKVKYHVHRDFFVHYSGYFRKALQGPWEEAQRGTISITDVEPHVFNMFVEWLYTQKLPEDDNDWFYKANSSEIPYGDAGVIRLELYIFADRFLVPSLRSVLSQSIVASFEYGWDMDNAVDEIAVAFDNLPPTDPLLDFFVDFYFVSWSVETEDGKYEKSILSQLPHEFLLRYLMRFGRLRQEHGDPNNELYMDWCSYHVHTSGDEKRYCKSKVKKDKSRILIQREVSGIGDGQDANKKEKSV